MKQVTHNKDQAVKIFKMIDWSDDWDVTIDPHNPKKSPQQKGLIHVWIRQITNHLNAARIRITENEIKAMVKSAYGPKKLIFDTTILVSTEDYSHEEMEAVLTQTQAWAATDLSLELRAKPRWEREEMAAV